MATATAETTISVRLKLDEVEARWLMAVMQNPLHDQEEALNMKMRESIFTALSDSFHIDASRKPEKKLFPKPPVPPG
jgi:hypothetical protein